MFLLALTGRNAVSCPWGCYNCEHLSIILSFKNHGVIELFQLEGTLKGHLIQFPCTEQGHLQLHQCSEPHPALPGMSPEMGLPPPLWPTCSTATSANVTGFFLSYMEICLLKLGRIRNQAQISWNLWGNQHSASRNRAVWGKVKLFISSIPLAGKPY